MACARDAPSVRSWSPYSDQSPSTSRCVSATAIGIPSTVWARIMAPGVNRRPKGPSGPERDTSR